MRKLVVIAIFGLAFLLIAVAIAPYFISTESYRRWAQQQLASDLDARVVIDKFRLRFIPSPGYTIRGFGLISVQPPFRGLTILSADRIDGTLSLFELLKGKVVTSVKAHDAIINYRVMEGVSNVGQMFGLSPAIVYDGKRESGAVSEMPPPLEETGEEGASPPPPAQGVETDLPTEGEGSGEEQKIEEAPKPADGPTSNWLDALFIGDAVAGGLGQEQAVELPAARKASSISISSVDIINGRLNAFPDGETVPWVIEGIDLAARNISSMGGADVRGLDRIVSSDIRMNGRILGSQVPNMSIGGRFMYDTSQRELTAEGVRLYLAGVQLAADFSIKFSFSPVVFDIHAATPAVTPSALAQFYPDAMRDIMFSLNWQGALALDVSAKGSENSYELGLGLDATGASIGFGDIFSKGVGLPFKTSSTIFVRPNRLAIRKGDLIIGEDRLELMGDIWRDEILTANLRIEGDGLDDAVLKSFFPKFAIVDSFKNMSISVGAKGALKGESSSMNFSGTFKADRSQIAGISIEELEGSFSQGDGGLSVPTIKGKFAGGQLSGNGSITAGSVTEYRFDGVVERMEAERMEALEGIISGQSSLIVHAVTEGSDALTVASNLKLSGSFLVPSGSWSTIDMGKKVFSAETWKGLEALTGKTLDEVQKTILSATGDEFSDLNASYEMKAEEIEVSSVSWNNPKYVVEDMEVTIPVSGHGGYSPKREGDVSREEVKFHAEGMFVLPKGVATQLVVDKEAREKLLDEKESLKLPILVAGSLKSPKFEVDQVQLAKLVDERRTAVSPAEAQSGESDNKSDKASVSPKSEPKQRVRKSVPVEDKTKTEKQDTEEILKVIIGR